MPRPRHAARHRGPLAAAGRWLCRWPWLSGNRRHAVVTEKELAAAALAIGPAVLLPVTLPPPPAEVVDREPRMGGAMQNMFDRGAEETSLDLPVISAGDILSQNCSSEEEARR